MIDTTISHYRIVEQIGQGGMGVVYKAEDTKLKRRVVLKFLPPGLTRDEAAKERFVNEAQAASALDHPNICTIYEVDEDENGQMFIAMAFYEGETLQQKVTSNQLPVNSAIDIAIQIANGLTKAHQHGIIHRDIKPANVIITKDGMPKILDFGIAKLSTQTQLTKTGTTVGTVAYMSPEQVRGKNVDHRTDIWSLGVVLYEMVSGQLPFNGEYEQAVMYSIFNEKPEPVTAIRADLSLDFEVVIDRALAKDANERYQHFEEMLADLKALQKAQESGSPSQSAAIRTRSQMQAKPVPKRNLLLFAEKIRKSTLKSKISVVAFLSVLLVFFASLLIDSVQRKQLVPNVAKHKQITFSGNAHYPAISPDGQFIAYVEAEKKLLLQDLSGGQLLELYQATEISAPQWTPDGSEILFGAIEGDSSRALLIPRLGGRPRSARSGYRSPDGALIAGIGTGGKKVVLTNNLTGEQKEIPVSGFEWLTEIDWSPKGERILILTQDKGKYAIWSVTLDNGKQRKIYEIEKELLSPRWSPRGDAIYFFLREDNTADLMKLPVSAETGEARGDASTLVSGLQAGDYYTLSANGKRLLYTRFLEYSNLWLAELNHENKVETKPFMQGTYSYGYPAISPDGKWVAFNKGKFPYTHIYKMPIAGGTPEQLTLGEALHAMAAWSPDGKRLAFGSFKGNEAKVWTMDANGDNVRQYTRTTLSADAPEIAWAPHNKIIYQTAGNRNLSILDPETEEERLLIQADSVGWIFFPKYSPDGKKVVVWWNRWAHGSVFGPKDQRGAFIPGLWVISLVDQSQVRVSEQAIKPIGWSPDGNWIYGFYGRILEKTLVRLPAGGGEPQIVFALPEEIIGASISADGRKFVCTVPKTQSDVWLMENFDPDSK